MAHAHHCLNLCHHLPNRAMLDDGNALPVMAQYPPSAHGVVSHSFAAALQEYVASNPDGLLQQPGSVCGVLQVVCIHLWF